MCCTSTGTGSSSARFGESPILPAMSPGRLFCARGFQLPRGAGATASGEGQARGSSRYLSTGDVD